MTTACNACGGELKPVGRGRPRKFCEDCLPPLGVIGQAEYGRRWRELNAEYVDRYKRRRRQSVTVTCVLCGQPFERPATHRRQVCSHRCRKARRREWGRKVAA